MENLQHFERSIGPHCTLDTNARGARIEQLARLVGQAADVAETDDGVRLRFARTGTLARAVVDFVRSERTCCATFGYRVTSTDEFLEVDITGRDGGLAALRAFYTGLSTAGDPGTAP
jgi:hypothetical protein